MSIQPDSTTFALSMRNFDALPMDSRGCWGNTFQKARHLDGTRHPERVIVELANTCNLDCPMCRVGRSGVNLNRVMPVRRFEKVAATLFSNARDVRLNGLGESTVVPELGSYLDVLERYDVNLEMITNGTGPNGTYERLLSNGATVLVSWDASDPVVFERLRRRARWDELVTRIRRLGEFALRRGVEDNLHLLFTLQPANIDELVSLPELAATLGVPNVIVNVMKGPGEAWLETHATRISQSFRRAEEAAREAGIRLFLPAQVGGFSVRSTASLATSATGCNRPWRELVVRWNLDVQVCNMFNPYTYGNLDLHPFDRIWCGAFAQAFRRFVNTDHRHPYCQNCHYMGDVYERKATE